MLKPHSNWNGFSQPIAVLFVAVCFLAAPLRAQGQAETNVEQFPAEAIEFFETKIRPVLVDHCAECHSGETEASGGLLLDARRQLVHGGDSGPAVNLQSPADSLLLEVISYANPDLQMPPEEKLPESILDDFRKWIEMGVPDPRHADAPAHEPQVGLAVERAEEHWAYRDRLTEFQHDSIDGFIDARLSEQGLSAAGPVRPIDLLRRLTFDLSGLPPNEHQIASTASGDPDAYDQLVNQLLASPAFGETFARHWMDVVRYAESITLRGFVLPNAWRYRNYLIDAYNGDRPFDKMVREQIAGDLIAAQVAQTGPTDSDESIRNQQRRLIATGFWALGNTNLEQQDKTQLEMDYIDEQLEVMGRAFLGQTIGCARCHDHKFDPIPTRDYYALAGIMRSTAALDHDNVSKWLDRPLPLDTAQQQHFESLEQQWEQAKQQVSELKKQIEKDYPEQPKKVRVQDLAGYVVDDSQAKLVGTWTPSDHTGRIVGTGYRYHDLNSEERKTATFEAEGLPPGEYEVRLAYSAGLNRASKVRVEVFSADGEKTLRVDQRKKPPEDGLWFSLGTYRFEKDGQAFVMLFSDDADGHVIADAVQFLPSGSTAKEKIGRTNGSRDEARKELTARLKQLEAKEKKLAAEYAQRPSYLAIVQKGPPKDIPIHIRGDVHNLAEVVPRGVLTAVGRRPTITPTSSGRLELADWLADAKNPLTARVYTNRVWTWLMGQGIVPTVNNFGTTGFRPTHPELLDWLTDQFVQSGWSTKHLVGLIVRSDAYQRKAAEPTSEHFEKDPKNQLYWRGHARRLTAEALRDAMLQISGELQPAPRGSLIKSGTKADYNYKHSTPVRSVYQPVFRNSLPELFEAFDFADPSASVGQRPRSTVATQSLVLANHPWIVARAKAAAERLLEDHPGANNFELIDQAFRDCFTRKPTMQEREIAVACLADGPREQQLARLVHALFASLDFRYLR